MDTKKDLKQMKKFIDLVKSTDIVELMWEKNGIKIGFKREEGSVEQKKGPLSEVKKEKDEKDSSETKGASPDGTQTTIKSKMVGTFHVSPSSNSQPYVKVGDIIKSGQKICMIEAMKVMREITIDKAAKIVKILIEDGHPVEYGQDMFLVDTKYNNKK